jgi:hypothetical protein
MTDECDEYNENAKKYFKTKDEFKLERIRNYFTPFTIYFKLKKRYEEETSYILKRDLEDLIASIEKICQENTEEIIKVLKK